ncbi:Peregrin [Leucoagaricus sp. SymC.cos]|nr:Peregrin [Leucoagaricus sp. SymC.cos]
MGRNGRSPPAAPLPKVVFEKIEEDDSTQPGGVHDLQARSYGYNDFSDFMRPEHYIRHIEPLESDLARQVEYDMDEQDQEWLDAINVERRKEQLDKVSCELFEIVMDRLEKEWFDLTKNIPKPDLAMPSEDSTCAICDDSEGENSNAIVFCDGCNLAVHQDCYGVPYIPEGQWLCRKCTVSPENPVQCILCPNEGGAFKQTNHGEWVHILCAIWVPETRVVNEVFMEPVAGVEKISKQRWKLRCNICDIREGACIQCAKASCFLAFHATCARKEKLLSSMKSTQGSEPPTLTCYCERHLPEEQQEAREAALAAQASEDDNEETNIASNKAARAYAKAYHTGPPLVPALIVNRIVSYIAKVTLRKKLEFVNTLCRYWSLKREARRGAPLLKRLHLEPWTAAAGVKVRSDQEKKKKLEQLQRLREDLLSLRSLTELCRKRESRKYRQAEIIYDVIAKAFFSHEEAMRHILDRIVSADKQEFFKNPVSKQVVPDYYDIVRKPMCWSMIEAKLDRHEYWDVQAFKDDVDLVIDNALLYNKSDSAVYRAASRLKRNVPTLYASLDNERTSAPKVLTNGTAEPNNVNGNHVQLSTEPNGIDPFEDAMDIDEASKAPMVVGDMEPPLDVLELLTSTNLVKPDLSINLTDEPLQALLNYELAAPKPPPIPAPPPPPKPKKPKRDRKAEYERAKAKKAAAAAAAMATAAEALTLLNGFRMPKQKQVAVDTSPAITEASRGSETPAETSPTSPKPHRRKRPSLSLPGRTEIPPVVSDVDNRDSFKMFDAGWILPPEQRRGGRMPVDRSLQPPPRKRARTEQAPSRLSVVSTPASENQTLLTSPQQEAAPPLSSVSNASATAVPDQSSYPSPTPLSSSSSKIISPLDLLEQTSKIIEGANGTIIIEELDTPAIRRAKNLKRKEEKRQERLRRGSMAADAPIESAGGEPSTALTKGGGADSELSSLSEFGSEVTEDSGKHNSSRKRARGRRKSSAAAVTLPGPKKDSMANVIVAEGQTLEGGTLVWAKADSYPWWPAVIFEQDDPGVPRNILQGCLEAREKRKTKLHILRFFDKHKSWQYLSNDRLLLLKEDDDLDAEMQAPSSRRQRWKSANVRRDCCEAYALALAEMETNSDQDHQYPDPGNNPVSA